MPLTPKNVGGEALPSDPQLGAPVDVRGEFRTVDDIPTRRYICPQGSDPLPSHSKLLLRFR
jgi:hypothetical protein